MKTKICFFSLLIGFICGLFGAGGGMVAVPLLKSVGLDQKKAQATAIAVILPLTVLSAVIYLLNGHSDIELSLKLIPFGLMGALLGTFILKKIHPAVLRKLFAVFMLYSGVRMLFA